MTCGLAAACWSSGVAAAQTLKDPAIYVAADGVIRYAHASAKPVWRALAGHRITGLARAGDRLLASVGNGLHALSTATGDRLWHRHTRSPAFAPTVHTDRIYVGTEGGALLALETATGRVVWRRRFDGWVYPPAVIADTVVAGGQSTALVGLDLADGQRVWRYRLDQELVYGPVRVAAERVAITTFAGTLAVLTAAGTPAWTVRDPAPSLPPVVYRGHLFTAGLDGVLRVRDADTGTLIWRRKLADRFTSPPAVTAHAVWAAHDRTVRVLDRASGRILARHIAPFSVSGPPVPTHGGVLLFSANGAPYRVGATAQAGLSLHQP